MHSSNKIKHMIVKPILYLISIFHQDTVFKENIVHSYLHGIIKGDLAGKVVIGTLLYRNLVNRDHVVTGLKTGV